MSLQMDEMDENTNMLFCAFHELQNNKITAFENIGAMYKYSSSLFIM